MNGRKLFPSARHRGSIYIAALATAMLMSVIGLSAVMVQRIDNRKAMATVARDDATRLAMTAVEHAVTEINSNPLFRSTYIHNIPIPPKSFGNGTFEWKLLDEEDNDLNNGDDDTVTVVGIGKANGAVRLYSVKLSKQGGAALDVMSTAVHAGGNLNANAGLLTNVTVTGGPISSNGTLTAGLGITLNADVQAMSVVNLLAILGNKTTLTEPLQMPDSSVFTAYKARATTIDFFAIPDGDIQGVILSPNSNPYGAETNPDGIYYIRVPFKNNRVRVRNSRVVGTLLVELEEKGNFEVDQAVVWEPASPNLPALIVRAVSPVQGEVKIEFGGNLVESAVEYVKNFNPPDLPPIDGSTDTDTADAHPSRMKGLVHVIRPLGDVTTTTVTGSGTKNIVLIADGNVSLTDTTIAFDPTVAANLPDGYGGGDGALLLPVPSSWKRRMADE